MSLLLATFVVAAFALVLERLRLPVRAREVGSRAVRSLEVLRDPGLDDQAKETALRQQAGALVVLVGILAGGSLLALGLPLFAVWLLDVLGLASFGSVLAILERVDFLIAAALIGSATYLLVRRLRRT